MTTPTPTPTEAEKKAAATAAAETAAAEAAAKKAEDEKAAAEAKAAEAAKLAELAAADAENAKAAAAAKKAKLPTGDPHVAVHQIRYRLDGDAEDTVIEPDTVFEPLKRDEAFYLGAGAIREASEAELALYDKVKSAKASKKAADDGVLG